MENVTRRIFCKKETAAAFYRSCCFFLFRKLSLVKDELQDEHHDHAGNAQYQAAKPRKQVQPQGYAGKRSGDIDCGKRTDTLRAGACQPAYRTFGAQQRDADRQYDGSAEYAEKNPHADAHLIDPSLLRPSRARRLRPTFPVVLPD